VVDEFVDMLTTESLLVTQVRLEAHGVISVSLEHPSGAPLRPWRPGAHLDVFLPSGLVRQYSLCGDPRNRTTYTVAVLREDRGRGGSAEMHDTAWVGRTLGVRGPRNHFELVDASSYLFLAGGIGITPILSMVREVAEREVDWSLFYGGRARASMAFVDALRELGGDRVHIHPQDEVGILPLGPLVEVAAPGTAVYCCGPEGMVSAAVDVCAEAGMSSALHVERFAPSSRSSSATPAGQFEVELRQTGVVLQVPSDRTLLEVVRDALPDMPYSCEEGYCGSCESRVLDGMPEHHDDILTPEEREKSDTMMICVGRSKTSRLVLDL
jgi:ferredoxin-NADP reductase